MTFTPAAFTERWYEDLPELYRVADAAEPSGGGTPLLRFLDLLGAQADEIETLADQIDGGLMGRPTDITDRKWLTWLGQFVGVTVDPATSTPDVQQSLLNAVAGLNAGTRAAISAAAQTVLIGTKYVDVQPHDGAGNLQWKIRVVVRADEAPTPLSKVSDAIIAANAKPAGFLLNVVTFNPDWTAVDAIGTTWSPFDAKPRWADINSVGA